MIKRLSVENYALIESLEMVFDKGFVCLTGETGSGKSILLGALGLVLGQRADFDALRSRDKKCVVEACFDVSPYGLEDLFETYGCDFQTETIIRREVLPGGKSRAFINDSPVLLEALQEIGLRLVDIHSQRQTLKLAGEDFQLEILDSVAQSGGLLADYKKTLIEYKKQEKELEELNEDLKESSKTQDYNAFLLNELKVAKLTAEEQAEFEAERNKLANAQEIGERLSKVNAVLEDDTYGILAGLNDILNEIRSLEEYGEEYKKLAGRLRGSYEEVKDIAGEVSCFSEDINYDPARLSFVNSRLDTIYSLQKKHHVNSIEELLEIQHKLESLVFGLEGLQEKIAGKEKLLKETKQRLSAVAGELSKTRKAAAPLLCEKLLAIIRLLSMPNASLSVGFEDRGGFTPSGTDKIKIMFSANLGVSPAPIEKVASGGELSRVMLAIKYVLAQHGKLPTIIFDEIDTGVSGDVAERMAMIMKRMSETMQVIAITHLAQIAAKGVQHFKVFKIEDRVSGATNSNIALLSKDGRIIEIAKMISGESLSEAALKHSKELLEAANN